MKRAVRRGFAKRKDETIRHIGMDEKSFLKGQSYVSAITDIDGKKVLDVTVDCKKESLNTDSGHRFLMKFLYSPFRRSLEKYSKSRS